jgi:serine/threonine-protein kinase
VASTPEPAPGPWTPKTGSEDTRAFYQERLNFFAKATFVLGVTFLSAIIIAYAIYPEIKLSSSDLQNTIGVGSILIIGYIWRVLLKNKRSLEQLFYLDTFLVVLVGLDFGIFVFLSAERETHMWSCFIWSAFMVFCRVLYVPSTGRRTAALSAAAMGPMAISATLVAVYRPDDLSVPGFAWAVGCIFYGLIAVVIATIGSRVIYGLRKQVRDAQQLGQYTLGRKIGEGGMGAVYEAHHAMLRRPTAIKLLPPEKAGVDNLIRFEREVQTTAELSHPNTVAIFDYGRSSDGVFYYAMEYLDGVDLDTLIAVDGAQRAHRVVHILIQAAGALDEAHVKGLIHRDIKPGNLLLCERGGVPDFTKVVDFGLVKEVADSTESTGSLAAGTPAYISPEAVMAPEKVSPASDIYGLGAVGYFLLTGSPVFDGKTAMEMCVHHARTEPTPLGERSEKPVSPELEAIIMSCLAKDPAERPQSAAVLRKKLLAVPEASLWTEVEASLWWRNLDKSNLPAKGKGRATPGSLSVTVKRSDFDIPDWRAE